MFFVGFTLAETNSFENEHFTCSWKNVFILLNRSYSIQYRWGYGNPDYIDYMKCYVSRTAVGGDSFLSQTTIHLMRWWRFWLRRFARGSDQILQVVETMASPHRVLLTWLWHVFSTRLINKMMTHSAVSIYGRFLNLTLCRPKKVNYSKWGNRIMDLYKKSFDFAEFCHSGSAVWHDRRVGFKHPYSRSPCHRYDPLGHRKPKDHTYAPEQAKD